MRYGYFDDENREYVITTPRTPLRGSIIWAARIFSALFPIRRAATAFTVTQSCCV